MLLTALATSLLLVVEPPYPRQLNDAETEGPYRNLAFGPGGVELQPVDRAIPIAEGRWGYVAHSRFAEVYFTHVMAHDRSGRLQTVRVYADACCINAYYAVELDGDGYNEILVEWSDESGFSYELFGLSQTDPRSGMSRWEHVLDISSGMTHEGDIYFTRDARGFGQLIMTRAIVADPHHVGRASQDYETYCYNWLEHQNLHAFILSAVCADLPEENLRRSHQAFTPFVQPEAADYQDFPWPGGHSRSEAAQD